MIWDVTKSYGGRNGHVFLYEEFYRISGRWGCTSAWQIWLENIFWERNDLCTSSRRNHHIFLVQQFVIDLYWNHYDRCICIFTLKNCYNGRELRYKLLYIYIIVIVIAIGDYYRFAFFGLVTKLWLQFQGLFLLVYGLLTLLFSCKTGLM